ncbi:phage tail tape measure protein [Clostridium sporogenes]|uniref:phage tail tape measure protein n=1 Tax=Clostridium sporogenes TaxID=1509 RepID=UPI000717AF24|nr:phage tail tape measure protein [Clostridium sporogenes]KRU39993.1 hypothetical protein VT94_24700 [Clostridium sporogenes]MBY7065190.1 phage tail tape measure protein [Clostridium sporogenes]MBY7071840.1 phage tail tape measure protein [Clostridium sporogenes]MCW6064740.1 hypothetical protein [Clostridium sporogenes]OQP88533.1 hypothetical protein VT93_0201770 [Clostridium sporogenes]
MSRFQFSFDDVERKLLKKYKDLKPKNKYTLKEIEALIKEIQSNWDDETTVTVICDDTEEVITYAFDNISIVPFNMGGKKTLLMPEIEKQTLNTEEIKDPNKLIFDINRQYQSENNIEKDNVSEKKKKRKKAFSLPNISLPFSKRKNNKNVEDYHEDIKVEEDFEEDTSYEEEEYEMEDNESPKYFPTQEIDIITEENIEAEEDIDFEDEEPVEKIYTNDENLKDPLMGSSKSAQSFKTVDNLAEQYQIPISKKHETVQFESYEKYMELGKEIDTLINEQIDKLRSENLIKFVGIPSKGITNTKIEEYRINFVKQCLDEAKFERLREHYRIKTNQIREDVIDRLDEAFEKAMLKNYEEEAYEEKGEELAAIEEEIESKIITFEEEQSKVLDEKANNLKAKQEMELQAFVNKQQAELDLLIANEQERIRNLVENRKELLSVEKKNKYEEILDNAMYTIKSCYSRELLEGKRKMKQLAASEIQAINLEIWNKAQEYISEIQDDISNNMQKWVQEIKEFNLLEEQEHQRKLEQEEILLKKEQNEIAKLQAKANLEHLQKLEQNTKMLEIKIAEERSKNEVLKTQLSVGAYPIINGNAVNSNEGQKQKKNFLSMFF